MSRIEPAVVIDPAEVTPGWMTGVLRGSGRDVEVRALRREAVGTGQMAHSERFFLDCAGPDAVGSVVGKFPSPSEQSRASGASGAYRSEVRFYTDLAPGLAIRVPECLHGAVSEDSTSFTLILEDMAPAAQGDQIAGASDAQIRAAVVALAGLHGPRWGDPALLELDWIPAGAPAQTAAIVRTVTPPFLERYAARLRPATVEVLERFAEGVERWLETMSGPHTLVHGDYRLDNLLFATDAGGPAVTAVDWQTVSIGSAGRDVGYLLGTSADPPARRAHEARMLDAYREALERHGVKRSPAEVRHDYRHGSFQGPYITMLGALAVGQTSRGDAMFLAMAERSAALIRDHDALALIA